MKIKITSITTIDKLILLWQYVFSLIMVIKNNLFKPSK